MTNSIIELEKFMFITFKAIRILCIVVISILFICLLFIKDTKVKIKIFKSAVTITKGYLLICIVVKSIM